MTTLTASAAVFTIAILLIILSYIAVRGVTSLNLQFLIDTPKPVGEGGGIGNSIVGSALMTLLASVIGLPIGIGAGGSGSGLYINGTIQAPPGYTLPANAQGTF